MPNTPFHIIEYLRLHYRQPRTRFDVTGRFPNQAAVLVPVTDSRTQPEVVLTKRADHLAYHSGEVSFPGGKWEDTDPSLTVTALRESEEEIGLPPAVVDVINVQRPQFSRSGMRVTPYVGIIPHEVSLRPNLGELDAIFRVPVEFFLEDRRAQTDIYVRDGQEWWSPVYYYEGYKIWGLTARVLVDFMNRAFDAKIERESDAPELPWVPPSRASGKA